MAKILVTGGAGFIGSHLVDELLKQGQQVVVLDNFSTGKRENLPADVEVIEGDMEDLAAVKKAIKGCDAVLHHAAVANVVKSIQEPVQIHNSNLTGTLHIFEAARQQGIKRVIYASSASVYGNNPKLPKEESDPPEPISPYAITKLGNEWYASFYNTHYQTEYIGLRYFNVFGSRQDFTSPYSGVIAIFCRKFLQKEPITIFGDGLQTRDFIHVSDIVRANMLALTNPFAGEEGAILNIGRGEQINLQEILLHFSQITGYTPQITYALAREGDIRFSVADIKRIQHFWGFTPQMTILEGLNELFAYEALC